MVRIWVYFEHRDLKTWSMTWMWCIRQERTKDQASIFGICSRQPPRWLSMILLPGAHVLVKALSLVCRLQLVAQL